MAYRALKRLHMGDEVYKEPGDLVPEAMEWTNLRVWLDGGFLEEVPDEPVAPKPQVKKTTRTATKKKEG